MDRTVCLNDNWYITDGSKRASSLKRRFSKGESLPQERKGEYTVTRKFICPKQVNDTVTIFFAGEFSGITVFADKVRLEAIKTEDGKTVYDVTPCLTHGSTVISAAVKGGKITAFYFSVKRKV